MAVQDVRDKAKKKSMKKDSQETAVGLLKKILTGSSSTGKKYKKYKRKGATALFQASGSMEEALLKGRWQSTRVAKIYLADVLSHLPSLTFSEKAKQMLQIYIEPCQPALITGRELGPWKGYLSLA